MNVTTIFFWGKLLLSIAAGGAVAYKVKDFLVSIVLKLMPMKYKMAENSVYLHGRISTVIAFLIILGIGGACFWGTTILQHQLVPTTTNVSKKTPSITERQVIDLPSYPSPPQQVITIPEEKAIPVTYDDFLEEPPQVVAPIPNRSYQEVQYYIQIFALSKKEKALKQCTSENKKRNVNCIIGVIPIDDTPFKLLLGPFANEANANAFLKRNKKTKGFPRPASSFDHFLNP